MSGVNLNTKSYTTWNDLDWNKIQKNVRRIQNRIYKARKNGNTRLVQWLQKFLLQSNDAKLLAVRQVTTLNKGKRTPGVDKTIVTSVEQKLKLALSLKLNGKAQPIRRVWIPKPGKDEKRPLGIPVITDRAKQALAKLALEPEWEAVFEPNSYGFRPGRGAHDAIEAIFLNLHHDQPKWIYDADIRKCFEKINHDALLSKLQTFPLMKNQIKAWLKAGVMDAYANTPKQVLATTLGTPQGGVISPLLANIALHGLEEHLKNYVASIPEKPHEGANRGTIAKKKALGIVRYADDFVIVHRNKEILLKCIQECKKWLAQMGLEINEEKSSIRDGREGFNFLGFQIIQVRKTTVGRYKTKIIPSTKSQKAFLEKIRMILKKSKAVSSYYLIQSLRPVIIGWANYYKYCECKAVFTKLTHSIFQKIRAWVFRRSSRKGRLNVKQVYFPSGRSYQFDGSEHFDNWILVGKTKGKGNIIRENFLPHMSWVKSKKHVKIKGDESLYSGSIYWFDRADKYSPLPLRTRTLYKKQKGKCAECKTSFTILDMDTWQVDHIKSLSQGGKDQYNNLRLLCRACHDTKSATEKKKKNI